MLLSEDRNEHPKQHILVRMLSFCLSLMLILLVIEMIGTEEGIRRLALEVGLCAFMLALLRKYPHSTFVLAGALLLIYLAIFTIPIHGGSAFGGLLGIVAVFLITNYSASNSVLSTINRILAALAILSFYYVLDDNTLVKNAALYDVLSIIAAGVIILLTTFYYDREIERYRKQLRTSNTFLREITDINPQLIFTKDTKRRFTFVNRAMAETMGLEKEDFYNKTDREIGVDAVAAAKYETGDKQVLRKGVTIALPIERTTKAGAQRWYETVKKPILDQEQKTIGLLGVTTDITNLKEKELELLAAKKKAEENDHLKSAFIANMSHEIRTPMNSIVGFSELLLNADLDDAQKHEYTTIINKNCQQLLHIVSDILDISKLETEQMKIVENTLDVPKLLRELYASFLPQAQAKRLEFIWEKSSTPQQLYIKTDIQKVRQILTNLISNALKYTDKGSVRFGYELMEDTIQFFVKDTGIGISTDAQQTVFERFNRADNSMELGYGGTGLGLAISQGFAKLLQGSISLISKEEEGSTFYFQLPYQQLEGFVSSPPKVISKPKGKTILIADDGDFNALLIERLLHSQDLKTIRAKNGQEAVAFALAQREELALVLMDIKMPILDGIGASKQIKARLPDLPIIAQSALGTAEEQGNIQQFDGYIAKPINKEALLKLLQQYHLV